MFLSQCFDSPSDSMKLFRKPLEGYLILQQTLLITYNTVESLISVGMRFCGFQFSNIFFMGKKIVMSHYPVYFLKNLFADILFRDSAEPQNPQKQMPHKIE